MKNALQNFGTSLLESLNSYHGFDAEWPLQKLPDVGSLQRPSIEYQTQRKEYEDLSLGILQRLAAFKSIDGVNTLKKSELIDALCDDNVGCYSGIEYEKNNEKETNMNQLEKFDEINERIKVAKNSIAELKDTIEKTNEGIKAIEKEKEWLKEFDDVDLLSALFCDFEDDYKESGDDLKFAKESQFKIFRSGISNFNDRLVEYDNTILETETELNDLVGMKANLIKNFGTI